MTGIDEVAFQLDQSFGPLMAPMVAFLMFRVALDLKWQQFATLFAQIKGPGVGLLAQWLALPALAFAAGIVLTDAPSVALGLLLVAACPAGALSNYLTVVVRGNAATSVSMTAVGTLVSVVLTPLLFAFWTSMNPVTAAAFRQMAVDPKVFGLMFTVGMALPIAAGMLIRARRPELARRMRPWVGRGAGGLFVIVVGMAFFTYLELVLEHARQALLPVAVTQVAALAVSWAMARAARVSDADHRAIVLEVGGQNVALGLGMAVTFFPALGGVAVTVAAWGFLQVFVYLVMAAIWVRSPATLPQARSDGCSA